MGSQSSTATTMGITGQNKPLTPQRNFEGTIHKRFVREQTTVLEFEDQFWSKPHDEAIEIRDVTRDKVLFKVPPPKSDGTKRHVLLDAYGVPVVGMESHELEPATANATEFAVLPGGYAATEEIFRFETRFNVFAYPLKLAFNDYKNSPDRVRILVVGNKQWIARSACIGIQRDGDEGAIFLIARLSPVGDIRAGKYRMEIAAGVDLSLMVLIAAAMDATNYKYATYEDHHNVKIQAKKYLREQKQEQKRQAKASTKPGLAV